MDISFELSKEHAFLPVEEIKSILLSEKIPYHIIKETTDIFIISVIETTPLIEIMTRRLSHSYIINEHIFTAPINVESIKQKATKHPITDDGSIAIQHRNRSQFIRSKEIVHTLADVYTKHRTVSLTQPEIAIRVIISDDECFVGRRLVTINRNQFQKRKPQHRPFFSPISMDPHLARLLVNLSRVATEGRLLDPFCGTGGILIEAGLMGITVLGSDFQQKMINGTKRNLAYYGIKPQLLIKADIGEISTVIPDQVDAIVTDLPYGKATSTKGEDINSLYQRSFKEISSLLKPGRYAVIGLPDDQLSTIQDSSLINRFVYPIRVHRSLTRFFIIYQKS